MNIEVSAFVSAKVKWIYFAKSASDEPLAWVPPATRPDIGAFVSLNSTPQALLARVLSASLWLELEQIATTAQTPYRNKIKLFRSISVTNIRIFPIYDYIYKNLY